VKRALLLTMGLLLGGCDDPLKTVELVEDPRVLGARVEVEGDAGRAAPAPGEHATVTLLVATPELEPSFGFALSACAAAPRQGARGRCAGPAFSQISAENGEQAPPRLELQVPGDLDPRGRVLVLGVVCPNGSPNADGSACDGPEPGTPVQLELELARDGDVNQNPELPEASVTFDGHAWPELRVVDGLCSGMGFPEVAAGSVHDVGVALAESDRDPLPRSSNLDPARESLQLSHFVSSGDITRAFESIAWNSDDLQRHVSWTAPTTPGLTRFWFVLRDFRGGGAFTSRAVCVQ